MLVKLDNLTLPNGLIWVDEFTYNPLLSDLVLTATLSAVLIQREKPNGRIFTFEGDDSHTRISREDLSTLYSWIGTLGKKMTLEVDGAQYENVMFYPSGAIECEKVARFKDIFQLKLIKLIQAG